MGKDIQDNGEGYTRQWWRIYKTMVKDLQDHGEGYTRQWGRIYKTMVKDIQDHCEGYTRPWWNGKDERTMKNRRLKIDKHPLRTRVELMCSGSVSSSWSTSGSRRATVVATSVINTSWLFLFYRLVQ
jgi:hypothetical protein